MVLGLALAFSLLGALGQAPQPQPSPQVPTALSDVEKLRQENLQIKAQLVEALKQLSALRAAVGACEGQLGPLQYEQNQAALKADHDAFLRQYETDHPGWTYGDSGPAKKPAPPPDPKKPGGR